VFRNGVEVRTGTIRNADAASFGGGEVNMVGPCGRDSDVLEMWSHLGVQRVGIELHGGRDNDCGIANAGVELFTCGSRLVRSECVGEAEAVHGQRLVLFLERDDVVVHDNAEFHNSGSAFLPRNSFCDPIYTPPILRNLWLGP
jgi:hypothetical protein